MAIDLGLVLIFKLLDLPGMDSIGMYMVGFIDMYCINGFSDTILHMCLRVFLGTFLYISSDSR